MGTEQGPQNEVDFYHTSDSCVTRSLSDIAIRHEAKERQADARPQAPKNRRRIRWNPVRIFRGREQRRCLAIVRRSRTVNVGQAPEGRGRLHGARSRFLSEFGRIHCIEDIAGWGKTIVARWKFNGPHV
jgi:hypothetical protein